MKIKLFILFLLSTNLCFSQNWHPVGSGVYALQYTSPELFEYQNKLFLGGYFVRIDSRSTSGVAYWNDAQWIPIRSSTGISSVKSFATYKNELFGFARSVFTGGRSGLVKYDASNNDWSHVENAEVEKIVAVGSVTPGFIHEVLEFEERLYVVGDFDYIGGKILKNIAIWDGEEWSGFFDDNNTPTDFDILWNLAVYNDELIIAGSIDSLNGEDYNDIARWDGSKWDNLNTGFAEETTLDWNISDLKVYKGELYVGGYGMNVVEGGTKYTLTKWDGESWEGIEGFEIDEFTSIQNRVTALGPFGDFLVIGKSSGETQFYNGESLNKIEQDLNRSIFKYAVLNKQLYACGNFSGGDSPSGLARLGSLNNIDATEMECLLFPNPTTGKLLLSYSLNENSKVIITIFDLSGKVLLTESFNDLKGDYIKELDFQFIVKQSKSLLQIQLCVKSRVRTIC